MVCETTFYAYGIIWRRQPEKWLTGLRKARRLELQVVCIQTHAFTENQQGQR